MFRKEFWKLGCAPDEQRAWLEVNWQLPRKEMQWDGHRVQAEKLLALVPETKTGSRKLLRKCGFAEKGIIEEDGETVL